MSCFLCCKKSKRHRYDHYTAKSTYSIDNVAVEIIGLILQYCHTQHEFLRLRLVCKLWKNEMRNVANLKFSISFQVHCVAKFRLALIDNDHWGIITDLPAFANSDMIEMVKECDIDTTNITAANLCTYLTLLGLHRLTNVHLLKLEPTNYLINRSQLETFIRHKYLQIATQQLDIDEYSIQSSVPLIVSLKIDSDISAYFPTVSSISAALITQISLSRSELTSDIFSWICETFPNLTTLSGKISGSAFDPHMIHAVKHLQILQLDIVGPFMLDNQIDEDLIGAETVRELVITDKGLQLGSNIEFLKTLVKAVPNVKVFVATLSLNDFCNLLRSGRYYFNKVEDMQLTLAEPNDFSTDFHNLVAYLDRRCSSLRRLTIDISDITVDCSMDDIIQIFHSFAVTPLRQLPIKLSFKTSHETDSFRLIADWSCAITNCLNDCDHNIDYTFTLGFIDNRFFLCMLESLDLLPYYNRTVSKHNSAKVFFYRLDNFSQPITTVTVILTKDMQ